MELEGEVGGQGAGFAAHKDQERVPVEIQAPQQLLERSMLELVVLCEEIVFPFDKESE